MKRWLPILIGLLISAAALVFAFQQFNPADVLAAMRAIKLEWAIAAFVTIAFGAWLRGLRWNVLLEGRLKVMDASWLWVVGFLFNNVLPFKIGEVVRSILAGRRPGMSFGAAISSVVVERLFDLVAVAALLGIALISQPLPDWAKQAGVVIGVGSVAALVALAVAARNPEWALNLGSKIIGWIPRVGVERARAFLAPFVEGLGGVSRWRTFAGAFGATIASWAASTASVWIMMQAFWNAVPLKDAVLALSAAGLGVSVPSAPSGVGPYEAAVIAVLTLIHYERSATQAFAIVMHAATFAMTSLLGLIGLLREGVSFGQIARQAQDIQSHSPEELGASPG